MKGEIQFQLIQNFKKSNNKFKAFLNRKKVIK